MQSNQVTITHEVHSNYVSLVVSCSVDDGPILIFTGPSKHCKKIEDIFSSTIFTFPCCRLKFPFRHFFLAGLALCSKLRWRQQPFMCSLSHLTIPVRPSESLETLHKDSAVVLSCTTVVWERWRERERERERERLCVRFTQCWLAGKGREWGVVFILSCKWIFTYKAFV